MGADDAADLARLAGVAAAGRAPCLLFVWLAIVASAILFGVGHLPAAFALAGELSADLALFIVVANASFGVLFGFLFWRFGLEAAMIAHATAHALNYLAGLF